MQRYIEEIQVFGERKGTTESFIKGYKVLLHRNYSESLRRYYNKEDLIINVRNLLSCTLLMKLYVT